MRASIRPVSFADKIADDFTKYLNTFHSYREPWDDKLDAWLHRCYANELSRYKGFDFKGQPYFPPSSANACPRELYMRVTKEKRDEMEVQPHQRRWMGHGTVIGDWLQREILLAERHYKKFTGQQPRFTMSRTQAGLPYFEDFVKTMKVIEHKGHRFSLFGTCDGVLLYTNDAGERIRVGLEIKSKQTTYAQTGDYSMRGPQKDHVKQVICYSIMYDVDYYLVVYVNASKKSWVMTEKDVYKYPDIRVFGVEITNKDRQEMLDYFAAIMQAVKDERPPKLDLDRWTFNNYKTACVQSLTNGEYAEIKAYVKGVLKSGLPNWKKQRCLESFNEIKAIREGCSIGKMA